MNSKSSWAQTTTASCRKGIGPVRQLKLTRGPSLVLAALLAAFCQASLAQDYDLTAPDTEWREAPVSGGVTLFQNVRIFTDRNAKLRKALA
jgi:hypothetical protein